MIAVERLNPGLARWAVPLLLAVAAYQAAQLTWQSLRLQQASPLPQWEAPTAQETPVPATRPSPLEETAAIPLFGEERATPVVPVVTAAETRLNLRLLGLATGATPEQGWAIIADGSRPERLFRVGQVVTGGNVRLQQVLADHVLLERGGRHEILRLPRTEATGSGSARASSSSSASLQQRASPAPPEAATVGANPATAGNPVIARAEWLSSPERILQAVRAQPVLRDGGLYGLEVRPARNAREFARAGLQPGDIITAIQGRPLHSIASPESLFQELSTVSQVELSVERAGQALALTVQLLD